MDLNTTFLHLSSIRLERVNSEETTTEGSSTELLTYDVYLKGNVEETLHRDVIWSWLWLCASVSASTFFVSKRRELEDHETKSYFRTSLEMNVETEMEEYLGVSWMRGDRSYSEIQWDWQNTHAGNQPSKSVKTDAELEEVRERTEKNTINYCVPRKDSSWTLSWQSTNEDRKMWRTFTSRIITRKCDVGTWEMSWFH